MATFLVLSTMANGISVFRTWMDAIGDNLANLNTVRSTDEAAFQARYVVAEAVDYGSAGVSGVGTGSRVAGIEYGSAEGRLVHQPDHPLADEDGMVRMPDIRSDEHTSELQSLMRISYAVFCLNKPKHIPT